MYQAKNISQPNDIADYLTHVQILVNQEVQADDMSILTNYCNELSTWLSTTSKCIADAEYHRDNAVVQTMKDMIEDTVLRQLSPSMAKKYVDSKCADINHLATLADRTHSATVHRLDVMRSIMSALKEEMKLTNYQTH